MRSVAPATRRAPFTPGTATSLALHLLLAALAFYALSETPPPLPDTAVRVEIVAAPRPAPAAPQPIVRPEEPAAAPVPAVPEDADDIPAAPKRQVVRAETMLAAAALADPRSRRAREEWRRLFPDERIIQLCNLEAMEQVHAWKPAMEPDFVVAYARADVRLDGHRLEAEGAALHDHRAWYQIAYRCEVRPDLEAVAAFEFELGEAIPQDLWEELMLPSEEGQAD